MINWNQSSQIQIHNFLYIIFFKSDLWINAKENVKLQKKNPYPVNFLQISLTERLPLFDHLEILHVDGVVGRSVDVVIVAILSDVTAQIEAPQIWARLVWRRNYIPKAKKSSFETLTNEL